MRKPRFRLLPRPLATSSDPGTDKQIGYTWRAAILLTAVFIGLRAAKVTCWQWWAVFMPVEVIGGLLLAALVFTVGSVLLAQWMIRPRALDA